MKIICFNGPPKSGKDTLANILVSMFDSSLYNLDPDKTAARRYSMASSMQKISAELLGIEEQTLEEYNATKDAVNELCGMTQRAVMIALSEAFVKPLFGNDYWVKLFDTLVLEPAMEEENENDDIEQIIAISDLGFQVEWNYLKEKYPDNLYLVQLSRPRCSFVGDSRNYVLANDHENLLKLTNDQLPSSAAYEIFEFVTGCK